MDKTKKEMWMPKKWQKEFDIKVLSEDIGIVDRVIKKVNSENYKKEIQSAKTPLTKIINSSLESALVLEGTILNSEGDPIKTWTGSGFLISENIAVTNAHTVLPADTERGERSIIIVSLDGDNFYKTEIIARDESLDLGIIKLLDFSSSNYLRIGNSDEVEVGEMIVVLGAPEGWQNTSTIGYIINKEQTLNIDNPSWSQLFFTDAYIASGSSGGAVVGMDGRVIGIVMGIIGAHSDVGVGVNTIIPSNKLRKFLNENNIPFGE